MENAQSNSQRYPLAIDSEGNTVEVPTSAVAWRVRKLATKAGRPKLIFDTETGRPLEVPLAITANDLAEHLIESGRYRLEAVDAQGRTLPGCVATTEIAVEEDESKSPASNPSLSMMEQLFVQMINANSQLINSNTRVMEALAARFSPVTIVEPQREAESATPAAATPPASKAATTAENIAIFSQLATQILTTLQSMRSTQSNGEAPSPVRS